MKVRHLAPEVVKKIRSDTAITSVAHCVEELVWNSLDAHSTCIAVRLNLPYFKIQVVDNGEGIDYDQMKVIGERYFTSKCHTLNDLKNLKTGGFRGEALASLKDVSTILMIESRSNSSRETYCKTFTQGKPSSVKKTVNARPSKGTTITVLDFMYNLPVRRSTISESLDLEQCRKMLQMIFLVHPEISFSLRNDATAVLCLEVKKCSSTCLAFAQLYGKPKANALKKVHRKLDVYEVDGYISTEGHFSKEMQYLFVNQRPVLRTKLHKIINLILCKVFNSKHVARKNYKTSATPDYSPSRNQSVYGIFILNITCPYDMYDIMFEPQRTMIEFVEWESISKLAEEVVYCFLKSNNLMNFTGEETVREDNNSLHEQQPAQISVLNNKFGLFSMAAKRQVENNKTFEEWNNKDSNNQACKKICTNKGNDLVNVQTDSSLLFESEKQSSKPTTSLKPVAENIAHLKGNDLSHSEINGLRLKPKHPNHKQLINKSAKNKPSSLEIPKRSVFPIESPVMLRVPISSTLSLLGKRTETQIMKLREKYKFIATSSQHVNGPNNKVSKARNTVNQERQKKYINYKVFGHQPTIENKASQCPTVTKPVNKQTINAGNGNQPTMENKSSQCPTITKHLDSRHNISKVNHQQPTMKNKISQCPSITQSSNKNKVSPFAFGKLDSMPLGLKKLSRKNISKQKQKDRNEIVHSYLLSLSDKSNSNSESVQVTNSMNDKQCTEFFEVFNHSSDSTDRDKKSMNLESFVCRSIESPSSSSCFEFLSDIRKYVVPDSKESFRRNKLHCSTSNQNVDNSVMMCKDNQHIPVTVQEEDTNKYFPALETSLPSSLKSKFKEKDLEAKNNSLELDHQEIMTHLAFSKNRLKSMTTSVEENYDATHPFTIIKDQNLDEFDSYEEQHYLFSSQPEKLDKISAFLTEKCISENKSSCLTKSDNCDKFDSAFFNQEMSSCFMTSATSSGLPTAIPKDASTHKSNSTENFPPMSSENPNYQTKEFESIDGIANKGNQLICNQDKLLSDHLDKPPCDHLVKSPSDHLVLPSSPVENCADLPVEKSRFTAIKAKKVTFDSSLNSEIKNDAFNKGFGKYLCATVNYPEKILNNTQKSVPNETFKNFNSSVDLKVKSMHESICIDAKQQNSSLLKTEIDMEQCEIEGEVTSVPIKSRWFCHEDSGGKKLAYIDLITGNSVYTTPEPTKPFRKFTCDDTSMDDSKSTGHTKKSHFFLTHDSSPFMARNPVTRYRKTNNNRDIDVNPASELNDLHTDLQSHIDKQERSDWYCKWRIPQEDAAVNDVNRDVETLLQNWENPMFQMSSEVSCSNDNYIQHLPQVQSILNSFSFTKLVFSRLQVIGQVDCKFIACIFQDFNESNKDERLLVLFDQHAVHERIRLEELIKDLHETVDSSRRKIKSSFINPSIKLSLQPEEIRLLKSYHERVSQIGVYMSFEKDSNCVEIYSVPSCLVEKDKQEFKRRCLPIAANIIENLLREWLTTLEQTRSNNFALPKVLSGILNSQACHGAVKFGDPLDVSQCHHLMNLLAKCNLPFQCAHGRPSVAPVLDLKKVEPYITTKRKKLHLWRLGVKT